MPMIGSGLDEIPLRSEAEVRERRAQAAAEAIRKAVAPCLDNYCDHPIHQRSADGRRCLECGILLGGAAMTRPTISAHADHKPESYRFARQRQDRLYIPLAKSRPMFRRIPWFDIAVGASFLLFLIAAFVVPGFGVWWLK